MAHLLLYNIDFHLFGKDFTAPKHIFYCLQKFRLVTSCRIIKLSTIAESFKLD